VDVFATVDLTGLLYLYAGTPPGHLLSNDLAITFTPSESITVDVSVAEDAPLGPRDLIVTNPDGNSTTVPGAISVVSNPIQISITSPTDGSQINRSTVLVQGTVSAPSGEVGVVVNGVLAQVHSNQFAASHVPLVIGANTITATATEFDGNNRSTSVTVTANELSNPVELSVNPESGVAPLAVEFSIRPNVNVPITNFALDADGDGTADFTSTTLPNSIPFTYTQPGLYLATATITDNQGNQYTDTIAINVLSLQELDTRLKGRWDGIKGTLMNKDIDSAVRHIEERAKPKYQQLFQQFGDHLPAVAGSLPALQLIRIGGEVAEYYVIQLENGVEKAHFIYFARDANGIWRLQAF